MEHSANRHGLLHRSLRTHLRRWQQSSPNAHLFGHPSALHLHGHPQLRSCVYSNPNIVAVHLIDFGSLMQYQAHSSYPPCLRLWPLNQLWCTPLRRLFHLLWHPPLHPRGLPSGSIPYIDDTTYIDYATDTYCPVLHTHLTTFNLHYRWTHRRSLQMSLHHGPQQLRQLPGFALTKDRSTAQASSESPPHATPPAPTTAPTSSVSPELASLGSTAQQLANRFDLFKLSNN